MGTDIHCVLQKRDTDSGDWETVLYELFPGRDHMLFSYLQDNFLNGLPDDFIVGSDGNLSNVHNGFWMGDHSFGHCKLDDFVRAEDPYPEPKLDDKYTIEHWNNSLTIHFEDEPDECKTLRAHKESLRYMFGESMTYSMNGHTVKSGLQLYRLIWGFDS